MSGRELDLSIERLQEEIRLVAANVLAGTVIPIRSPNDPERKVDQRIPQPTDVATYVKKQDDIKKVPGFHPLMRYEALNFADGKRSIWEIYTAVRAESLATGEWYYGRVTPEMVQQFFENAAAAGVVTLKDAQAPTKPASPKK